MFWRYNFLYHYLFYFKDIFFVKIRCVVVELQGSKVEEFPSICCNFCRNCLTCNCTCNCLFPIPHAGETYSKLWLPGYYYQKKTLFKHSRSKLYSKMKQNPTRFLSFTIHSKDKTEFWFPELMVSHWIEAPELSCFTQFSKGAFYKVKLCIKQINL